MARSLLEGMMQQIDPADTLERGVHLSVTTSMPTRDFAPRTRLGQCQCRIRLTIAAASLPSGDGRASRWPSCEWSRPVGRPGAFLALVDMTF